MIRVRLRPPTDAVTEMVQRNTTLNSGESVQIRVVAEEAEKCAPDDLELFEDLLEAETPANTRKPENWSREQYEREKIERMERERAARNPKIGLPDGWGERRKLLPAVDGASTSASTSASALAAASGAGDSNGAVMFDPRDLDFDLDDLLLDGADAATPISSSGDSGRGSASNISDVVSQNGQSQEDAFDMDDIDFDRCGLKKSEMFFQGTTT